MNLGVQRRGSQVMEPPSPSLLTSVMYVQQQLFSTVLISEWKLNANCVMLALGYHIILKVCSHVRQFSL